VFLVKTRSKTLSVKTSRQHDYVDVTSELNAFISETGVSEGVLNVFCPHTTASIVVQEQDIDVQEDSREFFLSLLPLDKKYHHNAEGSQNATAHLKNQLVGPALSLPVREGRLALGTWQKVFFLELCEPRNRRLELTLIGE
jgi:secondary thiamine-phosphate synthase enzyme